MWKKTKGFTLMELLVVVAVIALLLAVLMPSLRKAKEMAGRMVCGNHERQLSMANNLYANSWDEQFCPPMMEDTDAPREPIDKRRHNWLTNEDFRKYLAIDDKATKRNDDDEIIEMVMPDEYFCPADKVARYDIESFYGILVSYAYNVSDWTNHPKTELNYNCFWDPVGSCTPGATTKWLIGHKRTAIKRASEKINFVDSCDWWGTCFNGANYEIAWDLAGQVPGHSYTGPSYADYNIYGPVLYRHNEGANFAFYDGHVEWLPKDKAFIEDTTAPTNLPIKRDATGMWYCYETWVAN